MEFIFNPLYVLLVLCLAIAVSEWLVKYTFCKHLGTALLVILITAVLANLYLIPSASNATPVYGAIFNYVAPISIFYLLLGVNLRQLRKAGLPMLILFLIGAVGTICGVLAGMWLIDGEAALGTAYSAIAGMFTGTYIGGGINFNALALHFEITDQGNLYAGAVAVDNILTTVWMLATIALPKILQRFFPKEQGPVTQSGQGGELDTEVHSDSETVRPIDLSVMLALGILVLIISNALADLASTMGVTIPSIIILTTIALILAQLPLFNRLPGAKVLGMFSVYMFLAVIGAYCELTALNDIGTLGVSLLVFATVLVGIHGTIIFVFGRFLSSDWELVAVASQANIGGSTSALALAQSLDRNDLLLPGILVGALGNAIGTYLGFLIAATL